MSLQFFITFLVLFGASGYASWRVYEAFRNGEAPCKGCELKKNCKKFGSIKEN